MEYTLHSVAKRPELVTCSLIIKNNKKAILRPLKAQDINKLHNFLQRLSGETRKLSTFDGCDLSTAIELCEAINKYDKLRFVVEFMPSLAAGSQIIGLIEFSFDIPQSDVERYETYGYDLNQSVDCRFAVTSTSGDAIYR